MKKLLRLFKIIIIVSSLLGLASIIIEYGFGVSDDQALILHYVTIAVVFIFVIYQIFQFSITDDKKAYLKTHKIEAVIIFLIIAEFILSLFDYSIVESIGVYLNLKNIAVLYIVFAQIIIVISSILGGLRYNLNILQSRLHPSKLFVISFAVTIIIGSLLLMLPAATEHGSISVFDALFTSTSAVCVTGLITVDTATYFTTFGKIVIMGLFQIGGLGLMTFTTFFALFLAGGLGIRERIVLQDMLDESNLGAITKVISFITVTTLTLEFIGSIILYFSTYQNYPHFTDAIFPSVFHSISAFCNAGFSLFTLNLMDPIVQTNYVYTTTISILIILGGLGFPTIMSLWKFRKKESNLAKRANRFNLQSRIVVIVTLMLIVFGTVMFYILELNNTLTALTPLEKIHAAFFQSVTTRTAGFNTIDIGSLTVPTAILFLFLMFVGASPGGTGGGIKTTTFTLMVLGSWAMLRNKKYVVIGNRSIPKEIVLRALLKTFLSVFIISVGIFLLTLFENKHFIDIIFESFSAFGTVGLSRGITGALSDPGKIIITLLMFIGRVGPLAFIYSILPIKETIEFDLPSENISII